MSEQTDRAGRDAPVVASSRHLEVLRSLLQRDYLSRLDWDFALRDLAEMAKQGLDAHESFVALYDPDTESWSAVSCEGESLSDAAISARGSRSVLDRVRHSGRPMLTTDAQPLDFSSESLRAHEVASVLAVPVLFWERDPEPKPRFGGCLYAHRTFFGEPFSEADVQLMLDIARLAQPALNALRHLGAVEARLAASHQQLRELREAAAGRYSLGRYETRDARFAEEVLATLQRAARADRVGLLLLGPTGSGKSFLAQAYHYESRRRDGPFVVLDCSQATSEQTLAAELFGYAPHSGFANAPPQGRPGAADRAHGGTLFFDEVALLPRELQHRLLTLIQTGSFSPLGSSQRRTVDLQVVAATNADLPKLVEQGQFREDLYWRLSMVVVRLRPLSERAQDIPQLAAAFLAAACKQFGRPEVAGFDQAAQAELVQFDWSRAGNVRGLEQTVYRSVLLAPPGTRVLTRAHLKLEALGAGTSQEPRQGPRQAKAQRTEAVSLEAIRDAVRRHGTSTGAARELGISHGSLVWQLRKAGLTIREVLSGASSD
jgi:transcriptional regulator with GAF, ATPase, and Fis domain